MGLTQTGSPTEAAATATVLGAACDGDADRNMILGRGFFVTPSGDPPTPHPPPPSWREGWLPCTGVTSVALHGRYIRYTGALLSR